MAYAKLSVVHSNLGHYAERDKYAALALKHADRLTLRERYYIEGFYYSTLPDGDARSMEAYKKCIALDPAGNKADARTVAHIRGVVALRSGDYTAALEQLKAAQNALSVRGAFVGAPNQHVPIWYASAQAALGAGDDSQALEWFRRVTGSGYERASAPVEYVRSFYALGQLLDKRGDRAGAHDAYRRFVGYWKDGDLDRAQVADAERKISTPPGAR